MAIIRDVQDAEDDSRVGLIESRESPCHAGESVCEFVEAETLRWTPCLVWLL
jgi:hypothetical protein